jgi:Domain of unknown function (DUF4129)
VSLKYLSSTVGQARGLRGARGPAGGLLLVILVLLTPCHAADPAQVRQAAATVARDLDVQQKLPTDSSSSEEAEAGRSRKGSPDGMDGADIGPPSEVWTVVQYAILAIAVVAAASWLGVWFSESYLQRRRSGAIALSAPDEISAAPLDPAQALALADQMAAAGRYGPAMHQVWLAAVATITPTLGTPAADSLTSWELLRAVQLHAPQRQALREVVTRVDRAWFGRQPANLADYQAVRGSYQTFIAAGIAAV